ncbi:MAG: endonuclease/exonuclease/phosphatase family protein [Planctomycetota bacterium]|nr:MAG: endonuclease/exonuclease/phosphatase family protein [Planctomycetota bacterium]
MFCLNVRPAQAVRAVAAQGGDATVLIESTSRFRGPAQRLLPPVRAAGLTRRGGMPITVHAAEPTPVQDVTEHRRGWLECRVAGVLLFAVHAVAPYLPWRLARRRDQLRALADRIADVPTGDPALAIGDFNTADFERVWADFEAGAGDWRRLAPSGRWSGTWLLGGVWSPIAVDHVLTPPALAGGGGAGSRATTFAIPGSDHLGLRVDLPEGTADPAAVPASPAPAR